MTSESERGFAPVLANSNFRALWMAQLLTQISQNAVNFILMILIEEMTGSAILLGVMIVCFTLPGVIFSPVAGVVVDRFPKKSVLVVSNVLRIVLALAYLPFLGRSGTWELMAIYVLSFVAASVAQFFAPAEAATIPLLVGDDRLLAANSLFNLTMALSQVVGLLVLGPIIVSAVRVGGGFVFIATMYLGAAVLSSRIRLEEPPPRPFEAHDGVARWQQMYLEAKEGWQFVVQHWPVKEATGHMVVVNTMVMVLAMVAPGYAARVLGMAPQNSVIVFAPAGVGMLLATGLAGRWGRRLRRMGFVYIGLFLAGLSFATLGALSLDYQRLLRPILQVYPQMTFSMTSATMVLTFIMGLSLSGVNILAQTTIQEQSPNYIRGRVFSVLFTMMALVGIPPMLVLGEVADRLGIPRVMILLGVCVLILAGVNLLIRRQEGSFTGTWQEARRSVQTRWRRPAPAPNGKEPQFEEVVEEPEEVRL